MTRKDNSTKTISKRSKSLMGRFRAAYERLNHSQRQQAQRLFCEAHQIKPGTFRNKINGFSALFDAIHLERAARHCTTAWSAD